jgi:xanthine dehydrogenase YagS FAD-binding subunit
MQNFALTTPDLSGGRFRDWQQGDAFIAGGTDLLQLMKNDVVAPARLVDLGHADTRKIVVQAGALHLGSLATMADVAAHPDVRKGWPAIAQALLLSASPQIRNMGTVGGNLLQRTRCGYFRDTGFACNKREPHSGCPALLGDNRQMAIFGGSADCIATHPSDLPVALLAFDAHVILAATDGRMRTMELAQFYCLPGSTPGIETVLAPGEMITQVVVPACATARRSVYVKLRDRTSFAFALISAAVALDISQGVIRDARVALGGVAPMPWRLPEVETALRGQPAHDTTFRSCAALAGEGAVGAGQNDFKIELARRLVRRALQSALAMDIPA